MPSPVLHDVSFFLRHHGLKQLVRIPVIVSGGEAARSSSVDIEELFGMMIVDPLRLASGSRIVTSGVNFRRLGDVDCFAFLVEARF